MGRNILYHNNGNGTFNNITNKSGIQAYPLAASAGFGDYDNDGCPDLYLSIGGPINSSSDPGINDILYHNNCDGTFSDVTEQSGIKDSFHGTGVSWADYNNDGLLDIYVANYGVWKSDEDWRVEPNILYRNNGNGTFTNVTEEARVTGNAKCHTVLPFPRFPKSQHKTESVRTLKEWKESYQPIWFDYNKDGWNDLFIATDYGVSPLYLNNGDGTFSDVTYQAGMCVRGSGMGVSVGDYNQDQNLDIYVTNGDRNFLWKNNGNGTFSEVSENVGVANFGSLGWGAGFIDYNNDGYLDLYAVNGTVIMDQEVRKRFVDRRDRLFLNNQQGAFQEISTQAGLVGNDPKTSAAFADYNNDGFTDIFVVSDKLRKTSDLGINRLYQNHSNGNHWSTLVLRGVSSNRDGIGAKITLTSAGKSQLREIIAGSSFQGEDSLWPTFGLGKNKLIDKIIINWPSGITQVIRNVMADTKITIVEKEQL